MLVEMGTRERIGLGVEDQVDVPLPVERDFLRAMAAGVREAERFEKCAERLLALAINSELDERDAIQPRRFGQIEQRDPLQGLRGAGLRVRRSLARKALARLRFEIEQRLHRIDGRAAIGCFAEHVVEDFERQRSRIAGDENVF